ncbi:hypothetical protein SAMN04487974_103178 [Pelagibacterium luteolum]|uniref:Uncharacterized protein n=1 Tax=Pelagibacterium luteolum TaxID=440168 RepID=A0A1G7UNI7_9HYPH|nr:hypothetical protein SAMN04487974_103178 [Pelagibacterium luteolum]
MILRGATAPLSFRATAPLHPHDRHSRSLDPIASERIFGRMFMTSKNFAVFLSA